MPKNLNSLGSLIRDMASARGINLDSPEIEKPAINPQTENLQPRGVKLEPFAEKAACLPNEWARSGIFTATNKIKYVIDPITQKKERVFYFNRPVPTWSEDVKIFYSGFDLNQFDLRVWLACIREGRPEYLGDRFYISPYEFCEAARIPRGGKSVDLVYDSLERLLRAGIKSRIVRDEKTVREYNDNFLMSFDTDTETDLWAFTLNPRLAKMFSSETTWIDWDKWNSLRGEIAKALMIHVCSHEASGYQPQIALVPKLRQIFRIESPLRNFRINLRNASDQLIEKKILKSWHQKSPDVATYVKVKPTWTTNAL